jgi:glycosyltransferase involved in cell wall biosynthesis
VVVQTEIGLSFFPPEIQCRSKVIPNPIIAPEKCSLDSDSKGLKDTKTLITMGRLSNEKGFDLLLKAFVTVVSSCPDWKLVVWGAVVLSAGKGMSTQGLLKDQTSTNHLLNTIFEPMDFFPALSSFL